MSGLSNARARIRELEEENRELHALTHSWSRVESLLLEVKGVAMPEVSTIPDYGVSISVEEAASVYLRERAMDAVQTQVVDDLNEKLLALAEAVSVTHETPYTNLRDLHDELREAATLAKVACELALAKTSVGELDEE